MGVVVSILAIVAIFSPPHGQYLTIGKFSINVKTVSFFGSDSKKHAVCQSPKTRVFGHQGHTIGIVRRPPSETDIQRARARERASKFTLLVLRAADQIRCLLENDPADKGEFLSEGLYFIDEQSLNAFILMDLDPMVV